jgi:hypothetical protein
VFNTSHRANEDVCDPALYFLLQIVDLLKTVDRLWKEMLGYLPRIPNSAQKVPAMRSVLLAAAQTEIENSIYLSIASEAGAQSEPNSSNTTPQQDSSYNSSRSMAGDGRVSVLQRVEVASWKLVEKEGVQARSILESAVLLHEIRTEIRAYLLAVKSLRGMIKDTLAAAASSKMSGKSRSMSVAGSEGQVAGLDDDLECEVPDEVEEDVQGALAMRYAMHLCGWPAPDYNGEPFDARATAQMLARTGNSVNQSLLTTPSRSLASTRHTTPNASTANLPAMTSTVPGLFTSRRAQLFSNLDLRQEEFLTEYQALEKNLEEIVGPEIACGDGA